MAIKSKIDLNAAFSKGKRPKEDDFRNWQDSYYHKVDDTIKLTGWMFRSFLKELRAEGITPITTGGFSVLDIPFSVTKLNKIRVLGRAAVAPGPLKLIISAQYFSDKLIPSLNGVPSTGNPLPTSMFAHPLVGLGTAIPFEINTPGPGFDQTFDFASIPKNVTLEYNDIRFMVLSIALTGGQFNAANNVYYGFEYE
jgi:hypothetical protein